MVFHKVSIESELGPDQFSQLLDILNNYNHRISDGSLVRSEDRPISGLAIVEINPVTMENVLGVVGSLPHKFVFTLVFYPEILDSAIKAEIVQLLHLA